MVTAPHGSGENGLGYNRFSELRTHVLNSWIGEWEITRLLVLRSFLEPILIPYLVEQASPDLLKEHYIDLKDRPFFAGLVKYMHSGPVVAMVSMHVRDVDVNDSVGSEE